MYVYACKKYVHIHAYIYMQCVCISIRRSVFWIIIIRLDLLIFLTEKIQKLGDFLAPQVFQTVDRDVEYLNIFVLCEYVYV